MKTSNKLLLGLFILIVLVMTLATIRFKHVAENLPQSENQIQVTSPMVNIDINSHSENTSTKDTVSEDNQNYGLFADKTKVLLSIDKNTSFEQLNQYKDDLKKLNIDLNIKKVEFDSDNRISLLSIAVDCNDGYNGKISKSLENNEKIGFFRIYEKSADSAFGMHPIALDTEN